MNIGKLKYLPLVALALGLAACSSDSPGESSGATAPVTSAARIDTLFEADCGSNVASAAGAFDISQCQLNSQQVAMLQKLQPLKVEANCAARSVRVYYADGQLAGQGALSDEGTYQVPLQVEQGFSVLENGCPMTLEGSASGTIACETNAEGVQNVASVKLDTAFNLAAIPTAAVTANVEAAVDVAATRHHDDKGGKQEGPNMARPPRDGKGDDLTRHPRDGKGDDLVRPPRDGKGDDLVRPPRDGKGDDLVRHPRDGKGEPVAVPAPSATPAPKGGKGGDDLVRPPHDGKGDGLVRPPHDGKGEPAAVGAPAPSATPAPKGGKGEQKGGQGPGSISGQRLDACVSLNPCVFNSSASLSCSQ